MNHIAFIDVEIAPKSRKILDVGGITENGIELHSKSVYDLLRFMSRKKYICGHNIINHDLPHIKRATDEMVSNLKAIDTLYLSPLLLPSEPYHALLKDEKLQTEELNNPLNDAKKAKDLFYNEVSAFRKINSELKRIYCALLGDKKEFRWFFDYVHYSCSGVGIENLIRDLFSNKICRHVDLGELVLQKPIELAYCLAALNTDRSEPIISLWVIKNYPEVEHVMYLLRNNPCRQGCAYCCESLDAKTGLRNFFGFDSYKVYNGETLQEDAVKAAIKNESILAVFPTGGGKSITFQVPALMSGENVRGLTVVISPLQSLMKDQIDNLERSNITAAVTVNGLLDPIERAKSLWRVENSSASILYISPESLRSKSIENLLLRRNVVRFVIDEAHCFSSWGHDFRVDYLYIGSFIKTLQEKKNLKNAIPVSCFTATAKQNVICDIKEYFKEKLSLRLHIFSSKASRANLRYKVIFIDNDEDKYKKIRDLIDTKNCPTIVYVSRTKKAFRIAEQLSKDGYRAKPYHGKMDKEEKSKNQNAFIDGDVDIMVATSAFGMGVDKKDVGMVIHFELPDSLENYVQEAGRAGRDERITADCYALFNEEDLSNHFMLLNQTRLNIKEIRQIWKAIKKITQFRSTASYSALEIARKAGWDDDAAEVETRVTAAISALEEAGYLKRGQNTLRIFADSILSKNAQEAIDKIKKSEKFVEKEKQQAVRIIKKMISSKSRKQLTDEVAESRIDHISDHLGITREAVINAVNLLREEKILADTKDLTAFIKRGENSNRSLRIVNSVSKIERFLVSQFEEEESLFYIKELSEQAEKNGCKDVSPHKIKTIINFWVIKKWITRKLHPFSNNHLKILSGFSKKELKDKLEKRHKLARFIVDFLYKSSQNLSPDEINKEQILVEFSVHQLMKEYKGQKNLFQQDNFNIELKDIEDALFYLSRIDAITIEGGFLVIYNRLTIERLEQDHKKRYKTDDYKTLNRFYENKTQHIHIVSEYAKKMIQDNKEGLRFVEDYFQLNYDVFLDKYFKGRKDEIKRNVTSAKFEQLFGKLSPSQLSIIQDKTSKYIAVAAGPGSGKTSVLAHKLASLLLMEEVKHEQLLMLTFSRAAVTEFKKRLLDLIGKAALFVEIQTFHSYCFDLMGKVGSIEKSDTIIGDTVKKIEKNDVALNRITKTALVIDEAQDINKDEFALIHALIKKNEEMRVIAVGDDDQSIYEFRGASSEYLERFITEQKAKKYELIENYRSKANLVEFTNQFAEKITSRLKENPIIAHSNEQGRLQIIKYSNVNLIEPVVNSILSFDVKGTTCILTRTNDEALQIEGLLLNKGVSAKLIQTNEDFSLFNLLEIRYFIDRLNFTKDKGIISDSEWKSAKKELLDQYSKSARIDSCINLIKDFESSAPIKKYQSDFEIFVKESKLEDFVNANDEIIFVSTIHKAKGKEFDNVFIALNDYHPHNDEEKRQLYVAMTRAKHNLTIHLKGDYLDGISCQNIERINDNARYNKPNLLVRRLSHRDVWLDYFFDKQQIITNLKCGDELIANDDGCSDKNGNRIVKFSTNYKKKIDKLKEIGYKLSESKINYIVYWKKEEAKNEILIILPELKFSRSNAL